MAVNSDPFDDNEQIDFLDRLFPANVTIACIIGAFVLAAGGAAWALVR